MSDLERVERKIDALGIKVDTLTDKHADLRVHVERTSAAWGAITGLIASFGAMFLPHR